jgi:hypothetical protein
MVLRKGARGHRLAGTVFFVSMLVMATIGAVVSPFLPRPEWFNVVAGAFTIYLVVTAWATARRTQAPGRFEVGALAAGCAVAVGAVTMGLLAVSHRSRGNPPAVPFVLATIAALAAAGDLRMLLRGGISARGRLVRHLWRMCLALFIAAGSLFLGQPQVFPRSIRGTPILFLPEVAILAALLVWVLRVRLGKRLPGSRVAARADAEERGEVDVPQADAAVGPP